MIALLLAAQLAAAPPATVPTKPAVTNAGKTATMRVYPAPTDRLAPNNAFRIPSWCRDRALRTRDGRRSSPQKLGELPRANLEYAVDRRVAGCPVPTLVRDGGRPIRSR